MIRVLVADDHTIVRQGVVSLLEGSGDCTVVAEARIRVPDWRLRSESIASRPACSTCRTRSAWGRKQAPTSVRRTPRPERSKRRSPRSRSSAWMRAVTEGWVSNSASAARLKLRWFAT